LTRNRTISIVIPAHNEGARLGPTLQRVLTFVRQQPWETEIIVVDDGSRDQTADIVRRYSQSHAKVRVYRKIRE
jgi:glycosyltransferase involved in cell wall biosynthesis